MGRCFSPLRRKPLRGIVSNIGENLVWKNIVVWLEITNFTSATDVMSRHSVTRLGGSAVWRDVMLVQSVSGTSVEWRASAEGRYSSPGSRKTKRMSAVGLNQSREVVGRENKTRSWKTPKHNCRIITCGFIIPNDPITSRKVIWSVVRIKKYRDYCSFKWMKYSQSVVMYILDYKYVIIPNGETHLPPNQLIQTTHNRHPMFQYTTNRKHSIMDQDTQYKHYASPQKHNFTSCML